MKIDRRHALKFLGGSALGAVLSPLPWKVVDDVAIWTQNWSWIPVPPKGETAIRYTSCALCPAGCGAQVRCVGTQPVRLSGLPGHPTSRGFLCPGGLLGHHLPYDPRRVTQPIRRVIGVREGEPLPAEQAVAELGKALARLKGDPSPGRVAIVDSLPGRAASLAYRRFLSHFAGGAYIVPADGITRNLRVFEGVFGGPSRELGIDLERARTILSFGADLFEGWGTPGRLLRKQASDRGFRLTQVEPRYSNTAALADSWLPVRPGSEPILALGLASVLVKEKLFNPSLSDAIDALGEIPDFGRLLDTLPPSRSAELCGISPEAVAETAREMGTNAPCLALLGGSQSGGPFDENDYLAVNFLNLVSGAVGGEGGIVARRSLPEIENLRDGLVSPTDLSEVPDESVAFLMIDATVSRHAIPAGLIERKLIRDKAIVVSFSPLQTQAAGHSHYFLPIPLYLETSAEIPTVPDSQIASVSFSVPLLPALESTSSPVEWIGRMAQTAGLDWAPLSADTLVEARTKSIWDCRRGSVYSYAEGSTKANAEFASAEELGTAFKAGACWLDSPGDPVKPKLTNSPYFQAETWRRLKRLVNQRIEVASRPADGAVELVPFTTGGATIISSPLACKLTRESDLYPSPEDALMSPSTAGRLALQEGQRAELETSRGRLRVRIRLDETAVPGFVFVPVSGSAADPRNLCEISEDGGWRATPAQLRRLDV